MKLLFWLLGFLLLVASPGWTQPGGGESALNPRQLALLETLPLDDKAKENLQIDLNVLLACYPGTIASLDLKKDGKLALILKNKAVLPYDDGRMKSFEERLAHPDLEDMLAQPYRPGPPGPNPRPDYDPGRFRVEPFFDEVYGSTAEEVGAQLTPVDFVGRRVLFNARNGAARALALAGRQLGELLERRPELKAYVFPLSGTFTWRDIAGTKRKSPHAWGIAIDLNAKKGSYWRWQQGITGANLTILQQAYPFDLVRIFEECGFIWGGKWWHYDTLHFEYRPELLMKAARLPRAGRVH